MCTASWASGGGGQRLLFNRDERRTRAKAEPPERREIGGTSCLCPRDGEAGGTWLLVNEWGLCLAVMNNYAAVARGRPGKGRRTRGDLPYLLAMSRSPGEFRTSLGKLSLGDFAPFYLCCWDRWGGYCRLVWDGARAGIEQDERQVVATSSFRTEEVESFRCERYATLMAAAGAGELGEEEQWLFHTGRQHGDAAFNPLMSRPDAMTHSVSRIDWREGVIRFRYYERLGESELELAGDAQLPLRTRLPVE